MSWYYNSDTGVFVAHIEDDDDYIYLITPEEINNASGDDTILSSYRDESKFFGQQALEGHLSESLICAVVADLCNRANTTEDGKKFVNKKFSIDIIKGDGPIMNVTPKNDIVSLKVRPEYFFRGYDSIALLAHEVAHAVEKSAGIMSMYESVREISADKFVRNHWAYKKASKTVKDMISAHEKQYL